MTFRSIIFNSSNVTSSSIFRKGLLASAVTSRTSTGLNSPRPAGTLFFMLSHSTLRAQARMELYVIRPFYIMSADWQCTIAKKINKDFAFIRSLSEGDFSLNFVKLQVCGELINLSRRSCYSFYFFLFRYCKGVSIVSGCH